jgi:acetyl esterase/lipase
MPDSVVPTPTPGRTGAFTAKVMALSLRASLTVSPKPTALALRALFAKAAAARGARQLADAPTDVVAVLDERYDPSPDSLLDVYVPGSAAHADTALPVVVWTHGGAFVGGSKEEIGGYLRMIAARGFAVVGVGYQLAPEARYPTPVRQVLAALHHLRGHARRLHLDTSRIVLAGDSAGAQISAQVAAVLTNPVYAATLEFSSPVEPTHVRDAALCCGIFDLTSLDDRGPFRNLLDAVGWSYSGTRNFTGNEFFMSTVSVPTHVTAAFPSTFVTAGYVDPLLPQSIAFAQTLRTKGVDVETLFYDAEHQPQLGHEYQFELDLGDGRAAFDRLVAFFARVTGSGGQ